MEEKEKLDAIEYAIGNFDRMVSGAEKLVRQWKAAVVSLVVAVVLCNLIWGIVYGYGVYKAYETRQTTALQGHEIAQSVAPEAERR